MKALKTGNNNPATRIKANYSVLMGIENLDTLKVEALATLDGGGISPKNAAKFRKVVGEQTALDRLRFYLTNFVLSAGGDAVLA